MQNHLNELDIIYKRVVLWFFIIQYHSIFLDMTELRQYMFFFLLNDTRLHIFYQTLAAIFLLMRAYLWYKPWLNKYVFICLLRI